MDRKQYEDMSKLMARKMGAHEPEYFSLPDGTRVIKCQPCEGSGVCDRCHGKGKEKNGLFSSQTCELCRGTGECRACDGEGWFKSL